MQRPLQTGVDPQSQRGQKEGTTAVELRALLPYLEHAKARDADFKVWDIYGILLLHLLLERGDKNPGIVQDLNWVFENTNVKDLINALCCEEGNPTVERDTEGSRSDNSSIASHSRATWTNEPYRGCGVPCHGTSFWEVCVLHLCISSCITNTSTCLSQKSPSSLAPTTKMH
jgi:hypothetical protein